MPIKFDKAKKIERYIFVALHINGMIYVQNLNLHTNYLLPSTTIYIFIYIHNSFAHLSLTNTFNAINYIDLSSCQGDMLLEDCEKQEIREYLSSNGMESLWHFSDIRNLPNVKRYDGLRSKEFFEKEGILESIFCGGDELSHDLDRDIGNWDKISLNFTPYTPFVYRKKPKCHIVFFEINPEVATLDGVYFTDRNAARKKNGQLRETGMKGLKNVKFDFIKNPPKPYDDDWRKYAQAEVLVPSQIPPRFIKKIYFISVASMELGIHLCGNLCDFFEIRKTTFADIMSGTRYVYEYPYLEKIILTYKEITMENCEGQIPETKTVEVGRRVWAVLTLGAMPDTKGSLIIKSNEDDIINKSIIFKENSNYLWWISFTLPPDFQFINPVMEIYLNNVLWLRKELKVVT